MPDAMIAKAGGPDQPGGPQGGTDKETKSSDKKHCPAKPYHGRNGSRTFQDPCGHVIEIAARENQAVPEVAYLVPEERPLDTGRQPVADNVDVLRDKEEEKPEDHRYLVAIYHKKTLKGKKDYLPLFSTMASWYIQSIKGWHSSTTHSSSQAMQGNQFVPGKEVFGPDRPPLGTEQEGLDPLPS